MLDRAVAERIAAGEVVERPASVVKELVENSLDAQARSITVEIEGAGLRLIRVVDDGGGIPAADVPLAFARFATSKIVRLEDLEVVRTFGFRGEALPSIAATSHVTLTTRAPDAETATRAVVVAGVVTRVGPHGAPEGTTVEVTRLFFNTPARMKFLKSPTREQALIAETAQRAAMAHPEVTFRLTFDGREAGFWPRAAADLRVAELLAAGSRDDLILVEGPVPGGTLAGWAAQPERSRPNRSGQHLFVNLRPIHSVPLRRAVEQGYAQLVPVGRFPAFALLLDVDPASIDVNIHPRKLEVRFRDESRLFGALVRATRDALLGSPLIRQVGAFPVPGFPPSPGPLAPAGVAPLLPEEASPAAAGALGSSLILAAREAPGGYTPEARKLPPLRPVGQLLATYLVAEGPDSLVLIDQHAAHERVLYERLLAARRKGGVASQGLAVPLTVDLEPSHLELVAGHRDWLESLGFAVEPFGTRTVLLRAMPALVPHAQPDDLLRRAIGALAGDGEGEDPLERLTIATACHSAIRAGDRLTADAIGALIADLAATEDPYTCFHGRPTVIAVPRGMLERWFLRG
ncbi:MAG: DNA mismatch repair endonuclease MutL [Armatimonadetes bacterium]|nr:DNA mismatch repair endonuclease MutL [Armatimonadota bacterium]